MGGVVMVTASGNNNQDGCTFSPGGAPTSINTNAATSQDLKASYSNWGSCTDIWAPGSSITSAYIGGNTRSATLSGTSMAAPHVAGVAAMMLEDNPSLSSAQLKTNLLNA